MGLNLLKADQDTDYINDGDFEPSPSPLELVLPDDGKRYAVWWGAHQQCSEAAINKSFSQIEIGQGSGLPRVARSNVKANPGLDFIEEVVGGAYLVEGTDPRRQLLRLRAYGPCVGGCRDAKIRALCLDDLPPEHYKVAYFPDPEGQPGSATYQVLAPNQEKLLLEIELGESAPSGRWLFISSLEMRPETSLFSSAIVGVWGYPSSLQSLSEEHELHYQGLGQTWRFPSQCLVREVLIESCHPKLDLRAKSAPNAGSHLRRPFLGAVYLGEDESPEELPPV